jgi:hypothetical protein
LADVHLYLSPDISDSDKHPTTKKFTILSKQPNKIPANLQILLNPINPLLLLLLVVLTTENMDGTASPLLHLFSFTSQNPVLAAATH